VTLATDLVALAEDVAATRTAQQAIRAALIAKGRDMTGVAFADYPDEIAAIETGTGGGQQLELTAVTLSAATAQVGVPISVSGTYWIDQTTTIAYQWLRNGAGIAGATAATYTPVPADSGQDLSARMTLNRSGQTVSLTSSALLVGAPAAPTLVQAPPPAVLAFGGPGTVALAPFVAGAALTWTVHASGGIAGLSIDAATGVLTVPTDAERAPTEITIRATNTGGFVALVFTVAVTAQAATNTLTLDSGAGLEVATIFDGTTYHDVTLEGAE
jgi:hypothetical protein